MSTTVVTTPSQSDAETDHIVQEHHTLRNELATLQGKLSHAADGEKAALQTQVNDTKTKMHDASERAQAKATSLKQETDAKIKEMEAQRASASAETKAKLDAGMAAVRADYEQRAAKLKQASEKTGEALSH
jgi:DNA repair exonuclease SbcCD ATPase subunit